VETLTTVLLIAASLALSIFFIVKGATGAIKSWREGDK